ncbi:MAG: 4Fe-4S binding protein [Deltaproteobacteria bacterium]|nr:4Fe-4S binding protein [Deltaproteobacteria bacterium]MBW1952937.1 4Fe-4S binding protein [Deltaproteobacteria bacterium]MBW1986445.1 4Fe-4S binding protein [Deltaproteobacteria bacterium]
MSHQEPLSSTRNSRRWWLVMRRASQLLFFLLFLLLFLKTAYVGQEVLAWPVDLFFRLDPLLLAVHLLTRSPLVYGLLWSLLVVAMTLILGRFFCGWVCPLGTALDGCRHLLFKDRLDQGVAQRWRRVKYYLLLLLLAGALFSVNLAGLFDPLCLLYRSLALVFYPAFGYGVESVALQTYRWGQPLTYVTEPLYGFLKATVLPFQPLVYLLPFLTLGLFVLVVVLEALDRRFWCRALCPLGALYGLVARFAWLRRQPVNICPDCGDCQELCKMGAVGNDSTPRHQPAECQLCLTCLARCPQNRVSFVWGSKATKPAIDLGRRQVVLALAAGVAMVPVVRLGSVARRPEEYLIRPPGAGSEAEFLARCVRCGQCMKVCPTNGLQPTLWEAGLDGLYTPRLVPRLGYCEYSCNLCSQVCPTGAIPALPLEVKKLSPLGTAFIDHSRCIVYTEGRDCLVCEEHCPVAPKAIIFHDGQIRDIDGQLHTVKLPLVVTDRCIGCGICENKCPVGGAAAIRVKRSLRVEI